MMKLKNVFYGTVIAGLGMTNMSACASKDKEPKEDEKQTTEFKKQFCLTYGDFKECMQALTPRVMLETILVEGVEFDEQGLCKPYPDSKGVWTIGFGLTVLDGKPVTKNTRHITIQEAWEKSVEFYENKETYFFMWCYDVGMDGLDIDTKEKALCLASVIYNSGSKLMEKPKDNKYHCPRNAELRELYKQYGCDVTADQVKELFAKYPIKYPRSFGSAVNGGTTEDWANALGGFTPNAEGNGMKWRRWLEGQIAMGNISSKDLLDLPMRSMSDFWYCIGAKKSVLFTKQKDGTWKVNPEGLKKFKEWAKNPVDKKGNKINRQTLRQVLNTIDTALTYQVQGDVFVKSQNATNTINFADVSPDMLNDSSFVAYKKGDYIHALKAGESALKYATTDKQKGAACYNVGITYLAFGNYGNAVKYLEQSVAYYEEIGLSKGVDLAKEKLAEAKQKRGQNRRKTAFVIGAGIVAGGLLGRKRFIMRQNQQYQK